MAQTTSDCHCDLFIVITNASFKAKTQWIWTGTANWVEFEWMICHCHLVSDADRKVWITIVSSFWKKSIWIAFYAFILGNTVNIIMNWNRILDPQKILIYEVTVKSVFFFCINHWPDLSGVSQGTSVFTTAEHKRIVQCVIRLMSLTYLQYGAFLVRRLLTNTYDSKFSPNITIDIFLTVHCIVVH